MVFEHIFAPDIEDIEEIQGTREFGFWETLRHVIEPGGLKELSKEINEVTKEVDMLF